MPAGFQRTSKSEREDLTGNNPSNWATQMKRQESKTNLPSRTQQAPPKSNINSTFERILNASSLLHLTTGTESHILFYLRRKKRRTDMHNKKKTQLFQNSSYPQVNANENTKTQMEMTTRYPWESVRLSLPPLTVITTAPSAGAIAIPKLPNSRSTFLPTFTQQAEVSTWKMTKCHTNTEREKRAHNPGGCPRTWMLPLY